MSINENELKENELNENDVDALAAQFLAEADALEKGTAEEAGTVGEKTAEETGKAEAHAEKNGGDLSAQIEEALASPEGADVPADEEAESVYMEAASPDEETASADEEPVKTEEGLRGGDVLPFTISVADSDGICVTVLEKGTRLPAAVKMSFSAPYKTPSAVKIRLYMGEGIFEKDNTQIGYFKLSGIREYKGGITRITMTLHMDSNGDIDVDLLDEGSVSRKHEKIELDLEECRAALAGKADGPSAKDIELRASFLVVQRAKYVKNTAEIILKANKKEIDKAAGIKEKIKELGRAIKSTDPMNASPAQRTALKNMMNELSSMF